MNKFSFLSDRLYWIPQKEFSKLLDLEVTPLVKTKLFADYCRINILYMIASAGSGHIGSSFSSLEIVTWIMTQLGSTPNTPESNEIFFSSKGHDVPAFYSVMLGLGLIDFEYIHKFRKINGLPGHPDINTKYIVTNTGSLGMGISKAKGIIAANRLLNQQKNVYVITGDGELQEGQIWESLIGAANNNYHELTVIVDHNKIQSDTYVSEVSDLGDLSLKFKAFGWDVYRCNGNSVSDLQKIFSARRSSNKPTVIIADTIKGFGVSFMHGQSIDSDIEFYRYHSGSPSKVDYIKALEEIYSRIHDNIKEVAPSPSLESTQDVKGAAIQISNKQSLIPAYSDALLKAANTCEKLIALNADLIRDSGLVNFRNKYKDRFFECGIAEQDMVSQAGAMARHGLLPVVHSFSSFLSARATEQIYNNATELSKIIYVGSLAGILPSGPGHSHQGVRDLSTLSSIPGLTLIAPSCPEEVQPLLNWCIDTNKNSSYLRLCSISHDIPFALPNNYMPTLGQGFTLREGNDSVLIAYGPINLATAYNASKYLDEHYNLKVKVVALPWLNVIDKDWLLNSISGKVIFSIDDHYIIGGQGDRIADILACQPTNIPLCRIGIKDIPACGTNEQCLSYHKLDCSSIVDTILSRL